METLVAGQKYKTIRYHLVEHDSFICGDTNCHRIEKGDVFHCHRCHKKFCARHWVRHQANELMEVLSK